ncbi:MAG: transposase family protein [Treponema sp.]|jgi:hypothetical protein|nr:transposase family protein [Treponema sp.]
MNKQPLPPLIDFFKHIEDPRIERNNLYPLLEVIDHPAGHHGLRRRVGSHRNLRKNHGRVAENVAPLDKGIPKHAVYRRVLTRLKSESIASCFMAWVRAIQRDIHQEVADLTSDAIDGKTLRGSCNTRQESKGIFWSAPGPPRTAWSLPR